MFLYESQFMQDMWGSLEIATAPSCYVRIGELLNTEILEYACILFKGKLLPSLFLLSTRYCPCTTSYLLDCSTFFLNVESLCLVVTLVLVVSLMLVVSLVLVVSLAEIGPSILMSSLSITHLILI